LSQLVPTQTNVEKSKIKAAEELGAVVITSDMFEVIKPPEPVLPWNEYLKENDHWSNDEDFTAEEKKETGV
jgi:hypothetical protein